MSIEDSSLEFVSICTHYQGEEEEIRSLYDELISVERPDSMSNEERLVDNTDLQEFYVLFSEGPTEVPSPGEHSAFEFEIDSDWDLHIHSYAEISKRENVFDLHKELISIAGDVELTHFNLYGMLDGEFKDLSIDLTHPESVTMDAIRFANGGQSYSLNQTDEGVSLMTSYEEESSPLSPDDLDELTESKIQVTQDTIDKLTDER